MMRTLIPAALLAGALALTGCGSPGPAPEPSICARVSDNVRVEDSRCAAAGVGTAIDPDGNQVRILSADVECLDFDDHTPVGTVADDDYLEGCGGEDEGHAKRSPAAAKTTPKATPTKAAKTTTKKPTTRKTT